MADKKLNEVTANATVDYVIGTLNDGSTVRISKADLRRAVMNLESMGVGRTPGSNWVRIAKTVSTSVNGNAFIVMVWRNYNTGQNESYTFSVNTMYNKAYVTQLSGGCCMTSNRRLTKVRVTGNTGSTFFFDIYLNSTTDPNEYRWIVIGGASALTTWESTPAAGANSKELETTDM